MPPLTSTQLRLLRYMRDGRIQTPAGNPNAAYNTDDGSDVSSMAWELFHRGMARVGSLGAWELTELGLLSLGRRQPFC